jgi:hypothetical protein
VESDPFLNFISSLSEKINVEKEHKALMERINSETPSQEDLSLAKTLANLQEKITQQVQTHINSTAPIVEDKGIVEREEIKPIIVQAEEQEEVVEEEDAFVSFVDKLKDILATPKTVKPIEEKKPDVIKPVEEVQPEVITSVEEVKTPEVQTPKSNYIEELDKISASTPEPQTTKDVYVSELDKLSTKVANEAEPGKVQDIKKLLEEYMEKYLKKAAILSEYAGGGGSNAVQYANGGTMNGTLNVTGQYLSGGVDLYSIFSGGGGGGNQTLSFDSNTANLSISNGNTVSLLSLSATGSSGNPAVNSVVIGSSANWNSSYTTLTGNSAYWNTAYTNLATNSAAYLSAVDISFLSVSGNWNSTYNTVSSLSSNWSTAYSTVQSASGNWGADYTAYTLLTANSGNWQSTYTTVSSNSSNWQTGYNNAIYNVNGTANQITVTPAGNNTGNNSVTVSLPSSVNVSTLNVLNSLNVAGSANFYNTNNLNVSSNIIYYGEGNIGNTLDLGLVTHFVGNLNNGQNKYQHTGLVRKAGQNSPSIWTLFSGLTTEPGDVNSGINWSDPYLTLDTLSANVLGNLSGSYVTVGGGNSNQWNSAYASTTALNTTFSKLSSQAYTYNTSTSSVVPSIFKNTNSGVYNIILGGANNSTLGSSNALLNTFSSTVTAVTGYCDASGAGATFGTPPYISTNNIIGGGNNNRIYGCAIATGYFDNGACTQIPIAGCSIVKSNSIINGCNNLITQPKSTVSDYYHTATYAGTVSILGNTIINGCSNNIGSCYSTITNGLSNIACFGGNHAFIGSGICNTTSGIYNIVGAGRCNTSSGNYSSIINGACNIASSSYSTIVGGCKNNTNGLANTFILGSNIKASCANFTYVNNLSSGGKLYGDGTNITNVQNIIFTTQDNSSLYPISIARNIKPACYSNSNIDSGYYSSIITAGTNNCLCGGATYYGRGFYGNNHIIIGGDSNLICHTDFCGSVGFDNNTIGNGGSNKIIGTSSGYYNYQICNWVGSYYGSSNNSIINGSCNVIKAVGITSSGTYLNKYSSIINGVCNCIQTGTSNDASYSSIIGGCKNSIYGTYNTIAGGCNNALSGTNSFILGSNINTNISNYTLVNNLSSQGILGGNNLTLANATLSSTLINPLTAGPLLILSINGVNRALQLWNFTT